MAEKAKGMDTVKEVTVGAKVGQSEGGQHTANSGKAKEEGKLNEVNGQIACFHHSTFIQYLQQKNYLGPILDRS